MASLLFTDTDAVRASVGVSAVEVPDSMLTGQGLERQMKTDLYSWLPTYQALYDAGVASGATADAQQISDLLINYCLFFGAVRVIEMVRSHRQSVSDGKQELSRFAVDWKELLDEYKAKLAETRELLEEALGLGVDATSFFGRASPSYDPVTNT